MGTLIFMTLVIAAMLFCAVMCAAEMPEFPTARDVSVPAKVPTPNDTIPLEQMTNLVSHEASAEYAPDRVISPPMAIAVRQQHPDGPTCQEAVTYTFLLHDMKFAGVERIAGGRLILVSVGWLKDTPKIEPSIFTMFSDDEGVSWTQPKVISHGGDERPEPIWLGGDNLMLITRDDPGHICCSDDGGQTWGEMKPFPTMPDGRV